MGATQGAQREVTWPVTALSPFVRAAVALASPVLGLLLGVPIATVALASAVSLLSIVELLRRNRRPASSTIAFLAAVVATGLVSYEAAAANESSTVALLVTVGLIAFALIATFWLTYRPPGGLPSLAWRRSKGARGLLYFGLGSAFLPGSMVVAALDGAVKGSLALELAPLVATVAVGTVLLPVFLPESSGRRRTLGLGFGTISIGLGVALSIAGSLTLVSAALAGVAGAQSAYLLAPILVSTDEAPVLTPIEIDIFVSTIWFTVVGMAYVVAVLIYWISRPVWER